MRCSEASRTIGLVNARFGDRGAAVHAAGRWRRLVFVAIASSLLIVGVFTAGHAEAFNSPDQGAAITVSSLSSSFNSNPVLPLAADIDVSGLESIGDEVLLICTVLGLTVAFLLAARSGPVSGAVQRLGEGRSIVTRSVYALRVGSIRLDRTALCIIRT